MNPIDTARANRWEAVAVAVVLTAGTLSLPAAELFHDFDNDGVAERLVTGPGVNRIDRRDENGDWVDAGYALPDGVVPTEGDSRDAGLRFIDLNGDGFDDVLFSNPTRYAIHLWARNVRPELGWTRGWSQFVRAGERTGSGIEPPSVAGASVAVEDGMLIVSRPPETERVALRPLIACDMPPPKSPEDALTTFRVPPGFRVELVAAEPLVIDPVAFDWDASGRLWVVEMRDYPAGIDGNGSPGGVVKRLEDTNGDGRCDRVRVFAEGLAFPTGVMPWRNGALISAAPYLLYAEDTDGDGSADTRRVLFDGFTPGNQQHRFNGFEWGLDGWIYAANGDSGGNVTSRQTGNTISISGRDVRFRPDTGEIEAVSGQSQFGLRRDDQGNWFGNNNSIWLWHVTMPDHYLRRNPQLAVTRVRTALADYPDATRVFPASAPMVRPNQPWSLNHVTSACSPCPYRDDLFGPEFAATVFISEPVHNLIHREVLECEGAGFASRRAAGDERGEFLTSTDPWFRPTTLRTGPDGALYVADMYRFVIEHPEWISPEMQERMDLRAGDDKGRIYRIVPVDRPLRAVPDLSRMSTAELVAALNSPGGWQRDMAMRLLIARPDPSAVPALRALLSLTHPPDVRIQALATLALLEFLTPGDVTSALADPHPAVRCEALRRSESFAGRGEGVFAAVAALAGDSDASVRLQAAFSLGAWPPDRREPPLRDLAARADADESLRNAVLSSLNPDSPLFAQLNSGEPPPQAAEIAIAPAASSSDRAAVIARYSGVDSLAGDPARGHQLYLSLCATCHTLRGEGHDVGPDLGMAATKPTDWLLTAIFDPAQVVEARYRAWVVTLESDGSLAGLISAETANNLVLRMAGGAERAILRSDIATMTPYPLSLMPAGFESALDPRGMADLIRWLRAP